jgi:hypothetical protein
MRLVICILPSQRSVVEVCRVILFRRNTLSQMWFSLVQFVVDASALREVVVLVSPYFHISGGHIDSTSDANKQRSDCSL